MMNHKIVADGVILAFLSGILLVATPIQNVIVSLSGIESEQLIIILITAFCAGVVIIIIGTVCRRE